MKGGTIPFGVWALAYDDLRDWIRTLEKNGELKRITAEVSPELEITEITDRVSKTGNREQATGSREQATGNRKQRPGPGNRQKGK